MGDAYDEGDPGYQGWFRGTYSLDARPRPWFFVKLGAIVDYDSHGDIDRDRWYDDDDRDLKRAPIRFRDLALGFRAGEATIVAGRQRLTWQRTTFVNATDNLHRGIGPTRSTPHGCPRTPSTRSGSSSRFSLEAALVPRYALAIAPAQRALALNSRHSLCRSAMLRSRR